MSQAPRGARGIEPVLVVIPTYNERENLGPILDRLHKVLPDVHVLVVDDGSPDGTGELADERAAAERERPRHAPDREGRVWARPTSPGSAGAWRGSTTRSSRWTPTARTRPRTCPGCWTRVGDADLAIGSRYVPGGSIVNWPLKRQVLSRGANLYSQLALGMRTRDITAGFRAYRRPVLEKLALDEVNSHGYCFQIDLTLPHDRRRVRDRRGADHVHRARDRRVEDGRLDHPRGVPAGGVVGREAPR